MSKPEEKYGNAGMRGESPEEMQILDQIAKSFEHQVDVLRGTAEPKED